MRIERKMNVVVEESGIVLTRLMRGWWHNENEERKRKKSVVVKDTRIALTISI